MDFNESEFIKLKLPSISYFNSVGEKSPYDKLYTWAAKKAFANNSLYSLLFSEPKANMLKLLTTEYGMSVSNFWVTEEDEKKLDKVALKWVKKLYKTKGKRAKDTLSWISLDRGPACFRNDPPKWAESGFVYIFSKRTQ